MYIPTFGPPIFLQQNRQTDQRNIYFAHRNMNIGTGIVAALFLSWEYLFRIFGTVSFQCNIAKSFRSVEGRINGVRVKILNGTELCFYFGLCVPLPNQM